MVPNVLPYTGALQRRDDNVLHNDGVETSRGLHGKDL